MVLRGITLFHVVSYTPRVSGILELNRLNWDPQQSILPTTFLLQSCRIRCFSSVASAGRSLSLGHTRNEYFSLQTIVCNNCNSWYAHNEWFRMVNIRRHCNQNELPIRRAWKRLRRSKLSKTSASESLVLSSWWLSASSRCNRILLQWLYSRAA